MVLDMRHRCLLPHLTQSMADGRNTGCPDTHMVGIHVWPYGWNARMAVKLEFPCSRNARIGTETIYENIQKLNTKTRDALLTN